jgi:preprotein translocase subunit SecA
MDHLTVMDEMRRGIGLEATAQRDPLVVYKQRGHAVFDSLLAGIAHDVVHTIFRVSITREKAPPPSPMAEAAKRKETVAAGKKKVGRNDPCPCGSGKKYKHCCGR